MTTKTSTVEVLGPWSLETSRRFWEGFAPSALQQQTTDRTLATVFRVDHDWSRAAVMVRQEGSTAFLKLDGDGDLDAAQEQVARFLSLDIDAREWPAVGEQDPVIAKAQKEYAGLRPCGFHSPYEAAAWAVLSQRLRIAQAARLRAQLVERFSEHGAFPAPRTLIRLELDLPGRKCEYLHAVAHAALDGVLDGAALRQVHPDEARRRVLEVKGIGPFSADLVVLRGANAPDALPVHEPILQKRIAKAYGTDRDLEQISQVWRPFRTWASVYLRVLAEQEKQSDQ